MFVASNGVKTAVILQDQDPPHPRRDYDNLGKMVCFHSRYRLGDDHDYSSADELAARLAYEYVSDKEFFQAIQDGKISGLRLVDTETGFSIEGESIWNKEWHDSGISLSPDLILVGQDPSIARDELMRYCTGIELLQLCEESNKIAMLPVYLYDHSGLAMSTGSFIGRAHHAEWDSGQVGIIYLDKETAMREIAMAGDNLTIATLLSGNEQETIHLHPRSNTDFAQLLQENGYLPVTDPDAIKNLYDKQLSSSPDQPIVDPDRIRNGEIYKRNHRLYEFAGIQPDGSITLHSIAVYNPDLKRLTEETWKDRALECLESEVKEYDSYLQNEVYGYVMYEGLDEIDSCWGFNSAGADIRELYDDMFGSWGAELREKMLKDWDDGEQQFDIEDYYAMNDYPELRNKIAEEVRAYITFEEETSQVYPFGMSAEALLSDKNDVFSRVVDELYDEHLLPDTERIHKAIEDYAGLSRALKPKISMHDLDPDRDYTAEELVSLVERKGSLDHMIANAAMRQQTVGHSNHTLAKDAERH